jgi:hypothetical protein
MSRLEMRKRKGREGREMEGFFHIRLLERSLPMAFYQRTPVPPTILLHDPSSALLAFK